MNLETDPSEILNEIIYSVRPVRNLAPLLNRLLASRGTGLVVAARHAAACLATSCLLVQTPVVHPAHLTVYPPGGQCS
jgi:hypothetical protein